MPRCRACDVILTDFEATRKIYNRNNVMEYPDLCNSCFKESGIKEVCCTWEREDLPHTEEILEEDTSFYEEE